MKKLAFITPSRGRFLALSPAMWVFVLALIGLPFVVFYSVRSMAESEAQRKAQQFNVMFASMRTYYRVNVAERIQGSGGVPVSLTAHYQQKPGAIPIPATLAIELGDILKDRMEDEGVYIAFISDAPFSHRKRDPLDAFQTASLQTFRENKETKELWKLEDTPFGGQRMRMALPLYMEASCVACHNSHPNSTIRNWKVGDVRGIQDISVELALAQETDDAWFLGMYLLFFTGSSVVALRVHRRANQNLSQVNTQLSQSKQFLESSEQALKSKVDELSTMKEVLDKAPFGITFADPRQPDLPLVYVNESFLALTGYSESEVLGRNCRFLQGPDTQAEAIATIRSAIEARKSVEVEFLNYRRNGDPFWNRFLIYPSYDQHGQLIHWVGCQTDITALKRAQEERSEIQAELQESRKLESLGLTIAGIAHDLNTPIGVSLTASTHMEQIARKMDALMADPVQNAQQLHKLSSSIVKSASMVSNNLSKAARLVRSFKQTTADATRHEWRKLDMKAYLDSLEISLSPLLKRAQCTLTIHCPDSLVVMTEPGALTQTLSNLLINATVHAFHGRDDRRVDVSVETSPEGLLIRVSDNGHGMSEEALAKAFTPFFTTRREAGGSGLGLFTVRRVVEDILGGRIELHSQQGAGTRFVIRLPEAPMGSLAASTESHS